MNFKDQVSETKVVEVTKPRTYLSWVNLDRGRDEEQCYERVTDGSYVYYVNTYNTSSTICKGEAFFRTLENMYKEATENES